MVSLGHKVLNLMSGGFSAHRFNSSPPPPPPPPPPSPPNAASMHQWIRSALVQIIACRLFGAKPLFNPMLGYCQLDIQEQTSVKFQSKYKPFHSWKCTWKWRAFSPGGDDLKLMNKVARFLWTTFWKTFPLLKIPLFLIQSSQKVLPIYPVDS